MTTQNNNSTENQKPTHTLRKKVGFGNRATFETIGAAWDRGDSSLYIKPYGTQIIEGGFYAFPVSNEEPTQESSQ